MGQMGKVTNTPASNPLSRCCFPDGGFWNHWIKSQLICQRDPGALTQCPLLSRVETACFLWNFEEEVDSLNPLSELGVTVSGHLWKGVTHPSEFLDVPLEEAFSSEIPAVKQQLQVKRWVGWC